MDKIIGPELEPYCFAYLDDIVVLGENFQHHLAMLREVFRRLKNANLKLNPEKCQFGRRSLKYLGHLVTDKGIQTDPDKISAIQQLMPPANVRGLRRFLGIVSWYRRFIPQFSAIAAPLHRLLKKNQRWIWGEEQEAAFQTLKLQLTAAPVLTCPDFRTGHRAHTEFRRRRESNRLRQPIFISDRKGLHHYRERVSSHNMGHRENATLLRRIPIYCYNRPPVPKMA